MAVVAIGRYLPIEIEEMVTGSFEEFEDWYIGDCVQWGQPLISISCWSREKMAFGTFSVILQLGGMAFEGLCLMRREIDLCDYRIGLNNCTTSLNILLSCLNASLDPCDTQIIDL